MKKFKVGAFGKDGVFSHWASREYDSFETADEYCKECIRVCSPFTKMEYRVKEVDV